MGQVRDWLGIEEGTENVDLSVLIKAAMAAVQNRAGVTIGETTFEYRQDYWGRICLPASPVREVLSVRYIDTEGTEQTVPEAEWDWDRRSDGAEVFLADGFSYPALRHRPGSIRVTFKAGYEIENDDPELILPPQAEMATRFLIGLWYENREAAADAQVYVVPETFDLLAQQLRVYR